MLWPAQPSTKASRQLRRQAGVRGAGDGSGQDQLRLMDDQTFETLEIMPLQRYEMACSCLSISLADDPNPYYIVGTAYAIPDEQEPSKVNTHTKPLFPAGPCKPPFLPPPPHR